MIEVTTLPFVEHPVAVSDNVCGYCGQPIPGPESFDFADHVTIDGVCYDVVAEERIGGRMAGRRRYLHVVPVYIVVVQPLARAARAE